MEYQAVIETKQKGKVIKELSPKFNNQLQAECWLGSVCREARELKVKIVDHYLINQ